MDEQVELSKALEEFMNINQEDLNAGVEHIFQGGSIKDFHDLSDQDMETVYSVAYNLYNGGKYEDAAKTFRFLCFYDHLELKYWKGLAASLQLMESYKDALAAYSMAMLLDMTDPVTTMHAADCHLALGNRQEAMDAFECSVVSAQDEPKYAEVKTRSQAMLDLLKKHQDKG